MNEKYIQMIGIAVTFIYGSFIVFLYAAAPTSLAEIPGAAKSVVETAAVKGSVIAGTYAVDPKIFAEGLQLFNAENYIAARDRFDRADPERRDANTQFYIAYSFYRQGWGRLASDDELFRNGLEAVSRVAALDPDFRSADRSLKLATAAELKNELEQGLTVTADDFNPLKIFRERK